MIRALNRIKEAFVILNANLITPKNLEVTLTALSTKAGLLQFNLDLGTDTEALVICNKACLCLAASEPDA